MMFIDPKVIEALRVANRVVVFTGAGVSAESGIPTFRDKQTGLWENFDAAELATLDAFERDPALVWGWYEWRRGLVLKSEPNAGHRAIAAMADHVPHFTLITQNIDDLHERAGSSHVLHLHGEHRGAPPAALRFGPVSYGLANACPSAHGWRRARPPSTAKCSCAVGRQHWCSRPHP
jgi:NAD-dependent deacetylase